MLPTVTKPSTTGTDPALVIAHPGCKAGSAPQQGQAWPSQDHGRGAPHGVPQPGIVGPPPSPRHPAVPHGAPCPPSRSPQQGQASGSSSSVAASAGSRSPGRPQPTSSRRKHRPRWGPAAQRGSAGIPTHGASAAPDPQESGFGSGQEGFNPSHATTPLPSQSPAPIWGLRGWRS